jgi:hypothetical protein
MTKAQAIALGVELPFDITKQSKGAQHAYEHFTQFYGKSKGTQVFLQKAQEQGKGNTIRQKVNSVYHKGAKLGATKATDKGN